MKIYLTLFVIWSFQSLFAQRDTGLVEKRFSCVALVKLPYEEIYFWSGRDYELIKLYRGQRSKIHTIGNVENLNLYTKILNENKEEYKLIGTSSLPRESDQMLFLIKYSENSSNYPLSLYSLDDTLERFPGGTYKFLNFTKQNLKVAINKRGKLIKANGITSVSTDVSSQGGLLPFLIFDDNKKIFETRVFSQKNGRDIVIITPPEKVGSNVRLTFIPQLLPKIINN